MKRSHSAENNVLSVVHSSTDCLWSPLLVISSTGSIGLSDSQLGEASRSFILFVKVPLLYCPPIYATSQVLSSPVLILRHKLYFHIAFMSVGNYPLASQIILFRHPNVGWRIVMVAERRVACY